MNPVIYNFADFDALLERSAAPVVNHRSRGQCAHSTNQAGYGHNWCFGLSFDGACKVVRNGWPEGRQRMQVALDGAQRYARPARRYSTRYDVAGSVPDVARAATGDAFSMETRGAVRSSRSKVITVSFNPFISAGSSPEARVNQGAAILFVVDALEDAGYSVDLRMKLCGNDDNGALTIITSPVKPAGESLDMDRVAFICGHDAFSRRLLFRVIEATPELSGAVETMLAPAKLPDEYRDDPEIYFPCLTFVGDAGPLAMEHNYNTLQSAVAAAQTVVTQYVDGSD